MIKCSSVPASSVRPGAGTEPRTRQLDAKAYRALAALKHRLEVKNAELLVEEADATLYQAKRSGRDRFVVRGAEASKPPGSVE
jgi:GGDEF domain-containing protein